MGQISEAGRERLLDEIHRLWIDNGSPSTRTIVSKIPSPRNISHTTVAKLLNRQQIPRWELLAAIVQALGGDPNDVFELWKTIEHARLGRPSPPPPLSKVEYCQIAVDVNDIADTCNAYGARGWALVRILASDVTVDLHHLVMRRRRTGGVNV